MASRRRFLQSTTIGGLACGLGDLGLFSGLKPVTAAEAKLDPDTVRFSPEIEPLVRLIEDTDRGRLIEEITSRIRAGLSYREVLAALLLAGVRNVQPRPSVGFKFHAVLVVNSAHLASLASSNEDRWLPILWALDNFKSSQDRDVREGDWTMAAVDEAAVPSVDQAESMFSEAMNRWDVPKADAAVAGLSRIAGANRMFELFARFGARDFRSIGHKAIFVANSYRTLHCIGWQYSEPVLRSLAYALLNHEGDPNPADSDLEADRPWRKNLQRAKRIRADWRGGRLDEAATQELLGTFRQGSSDETCEQIVDMLNAQVSPRAIYDGMFLAAGELLMRQPGIVALHSLTTTNALHYGFLTSADDNTRRMLLLQNAAFLPMFREAMSGRGDVGNAEINTLQAESAGEHGVAQIFQDISRDRHVAARHVLGFLEQGGSVADLIQEARRLVFLKGNDSHDYKFSSAVLEDYYHVSPRWRDRYLASSVFNLRGAGDQDNGLVARIHSALS